MASPTQTHRHPAKHTCVSTQLNPPLTVLGSSSGSTYRLEEIIFIFLISMVHRECTAQL